jgi:hypothetical protein
MKIKLKNPFKEQPSVEELRQQEESLILQQSIAEKKMMIQKLEAEGKHWSEFSTNGKTSGINWEKIRAFIRGRKK